MTFKIDINKVSDKHAGDINESYHGPGKSSSGRSPLSILHASSHHVFLVPLLTNERILGGAWNIFPAFWLNDTAVQFFRLVKFSLSFGRLPFWGWSTFFPVFVLEVQSIDPMPFVPPVIIVETDVSWYTTGYRLDEIVFTTKLDRSEVSSFFFTEVSCVVEVKLKINDWEVKVRSVCLPDSGSCHLCNKNS